MSKRMYEDLKEILCHELNEITRKGDIDREGLDDVYKLSSAITMIESLMKKGQQGQSEEYSNEYSRNSYEGGVSNDYGRSMRGSYNAMSNRNNNSYNYANRMDNSNRGEQYSRESSYDNSYDGSYDYSERRGRDPQTGRYVSRDSYDASNDRGYSRHTAEQKVARKLEDMLDTTQDPHIRSAIMQAMNMLKQ